MKVFLYGPPGSGKTSLGEKLARQLDLSFHDLDAEIEAQAGRSIPAIFAEEGESGFRARERAALRKTLADPAETVIALGGGALLDEDNRKRVEATGPVLCLDAPYETLLGRLQSGETRPLLHGERDRPLDGERLAGLLANRRAHYSSFPRRLSTDAENLQELVWQAEAGLGVFRVSGMGSPYDVRVLPGGLDALGRMLSRRALGRMAVIASDEHVDPLYGERVSTSLRAAGFAAGRVVIPAGEAHKTIAAVQALWDGFLSAGVERGSPVVALGGGVVGDLAGFAAATILRGVPWIAVPTSLLAMVDASLGGKTGADLPQGKNLAGAFHAPRLVLADPKTLETLPEAELRSGLAEVVKTGVVGDPALFELCAAGWEVVCRNLEEIVRRAMAVKIRVIEEDPYEQGLRAALNLGHTIGHGLERALDYRLRHGEAVAIGMVSETRLAERMGLAEHGLADRIARVLQGLGLPATPPPGVQPDDVIQGMRVDKKRRSGVVRFALPERIGKVRVGVEVKDLAEIFEAGGNG